MSKQTTEYHCPFNLDYDPMACLLLLNIENDADEIYWAFEPQSFDDPVNGKFVSHRLSGRRWNYYTRLLLSPLFTRTLTLLETDSMR